MARLDKGYQPFGKYLFDSVFDPFDYNSSIFDYNSSIRKQFSRIYKFYWPNVDQKYGDRIEMLKGACQPLADMFKDLKDTFRPYGFGKMALKDLAQPVYGLGNVLKGLAYLVLILPWLIVNFIYALVPPKRGSGASYKSQLAMPPVRAFGWFVDGVLSIVRGVTQIATTPLTYFIKMPLRGFITFFADEKTLFFENKPGIQALVTKAKQKVSNSNERETQELIGEIHGKYDKGVKKQSWKSGFLNEDGSSAGCKEDNLYSSYFLASSNEKTEAAQKYLALFQPSVTENPTSDSHLKFSSSDFSK